MRRETRKEWLQRRITYLTEFIDGIDKRKADAIKQQEQYRAELEQLEQAETIAASANELKG